MITIENINKVIEKIRTEHTKEYIAISINGDRGLNVKTSKFGGIPYIAQDAEVPVDAEGNQLALLAQINCTELPENDIYPKEGLLQFWIARDDSFGLDSKGTNVVKYIKDIDDSITNSDVLSKYHLPSEDNADEYSPFQEKDASFALTFNKGTSQKMLSTNYSQMKRWKIYTKTLIVKSMKLYLKLLMALNTLSEVIQHSFNGILVTLRIKKRTTQCYFK